MPGNFCRRISFALAALTLAGCQQNPFASSQPPPPSPYVQQQQVAMLQQQQTLQAAPAHWIWTIRICRRSWPSRSNKAICCRISWR